MLHRRSLCLLLVLCGCSAPPPNESELRVYYDSARWFQLRDAVDEKSPAFYRGAVAIAFQDLQTAEKHFGTVIESDPGSEHADEARMHLLNGYHRAGQYQKALSILDEALARKPDAGDLASARDFYLTLGQYPEQEVDAAAPSQISYSMRDGNMFVPLRINGKPVDYILDTGAGLSVASESEAARLGMSVSASNAKVEGSSGKQLGLSTAVAAELSIGGARLRNVAFFVFGDDQMPFNELPQQQRGAIGLPVLLALGAVSWTTDGKFEVGSRSAPEPEQPNLCFDGDKPIAEIEFQGNRIPLVFDTGAVATHLWPKFNTDFGALLGEPSDRGLRQIRGVAGTADVESLTFSSVPFRVAGFQATLQPAHVLLSKTTQHSERYYGNLGIDLLNQADRVTLDFRAMRLTLE